MHSPLRRTTQGFTLVEAVIATLLTGIIMFAVIQSVIVTRYLAEYDKQRLAAISAARHYMEVYSGQKLFPAIVKVEDVVLDNFNTPDDLTDDLNAQLDVFVYAVNNDGTRGSELATIEDRRVVEVAVVVTWNRTGRRSGKQVSEEISTYVAPIL